ncbi:MAG: TonB-dependent receptor [Halioglobus sp.]|jgi:iron complex outermembrane receptor protein
MKRLMLCAAAVGAAGAAAEQLPMEHVLVSVPIHKKTAETALPVTVLSGEALQRQAAATIGETLGSRPGIASASFGPGVGRPVIRGQQGPRALTLQNGTLSADVSSLSPDHGVAVEPLLADSIEVLRGPATLLYGGGAIGGVVNVVDDRIPRAPIEGLTGGIEYRYDEATGMDSGVFRLEGGGRALTFYLSGSTRETDDLQIPGRAIDEVALEKQEALQGGHGEDEDGGHADEEPENTDGYIANTDSDTDTITAGGSYHFGERGFVGLAVSHLETEYGIPPGAHGHHEEEHEGDEHEQHEHEEEEEFVRIDLEQTRYDANLHLHEPGENIEVLRGFLTYTDYEHVELEGAETGTRFNRQTWETRVELVHTPLLGGVHGVVGLQWREDEFAALGEEAYVPRTDSSEVGLFLVEDFHRGDWTYELGLRTDRVERDPDAQAADSEDFTSFSLSGSVLWSISPSWQAGFSLSRAARAPSTEELFSNVDATGLEQLVPHAATAAIEIGDPDLDEEVSLNTDFTLSWTGSGSRADLALFYNRFNDYIFLFNSGSEVGDTPVYLYGQDDAGFYGLEFESEFRLLAGDTGDLWFGLFGDMISGEFDDNGDVPRLPPRRLGARLSWSGDALGAWVSALDAADQDDPGDFETETSGYTRWDAGVDYRWRLRDSRELVAFLKWKNIGDQEIRLSTSFLRNYAPEAGESLEAGIRFTF